jgi:CheY-like chemotaxis protein
MQKKVLVVDDDRSLLTLLSAGLQRHDLEVRTATNGVEALEIAWDYQPDVVIMDIMMPLIDGVEAASVLKNHPRTNRIPIIFISGSGHPPDSTEVLGDAFVKKPFRLDELVERIESILKQRESIDQELKEDKGLFGKLSLIGLPDLVQILEQNKNTGILTLRSQGREGTITFRQGKIADAAVGKRRGRRAVFYMLGWENGDFSFRSQPVPKTASPEYSGTELLLEGMRICDESQRFLSQLPSLDSVLVIKPKVRERLSSKRLTPDLEGFLQMFDGERTLAQIVEEGGEDELATLERLHRLYAAGLLEAKRA